MNKQKNFSQVFTSISQPLKTQIKEWLPFIFQKVIAFVLFLIVTGSPLYFTKMYPKEFTKLADKQTPFLSQFIIGSSYIFYWVLLGICSIIYRLEHPFFEKYKINSEPWPWVTDPDYHNKAKKLAARILGNQIVSLTLVTILDYIGVSSTRIDFYDLPSWTSHYLCFFFIYLLADFWFYWTHRLSHHPKIYWIHKVHHEVENPIALNAMSMHVLEFIFGSFPIGFVGILILGNYLHLVSVIAFVLWQNSSNIDEHCGYEFLWMYTKISPFMTTASFHNWHHLVNVGNYAAHTLIWDGIFGTSIQYFDFYANQQDKKKDKGIITKLDLQAVNKM